MVKKLIIIIMNFNRLQKLLIKESFFHGFENSMGYNRIWVEIFKNPSLRELSEIGNYNLGMILTTKDVFIWDRNKAYHKRIFQELKSKNGIPILFDFKNKSAFCLITDASSITPYHHNPKTKEIILNNPWMSRFKEIDIEYYDQSIVGKWEDL